MPSMIVIRASSTTSRSDTSAYNQNQPQQIEEQEEQVCVFLGCVCVFGFSFLLFRFLFAYIHLLVQVTVFKSLTNLIILAGDYMWHDAKASNLVLTALLVMTGGAVLASWNDLEFKWEGGGIPSGDLIQERFGHFVEWKLLGDYFGLSIDWSMTDGLTDRLIDWFSHDEWSAMWLTQQYKNDMRSLYIFYSLFPKNEDAVQTLSSNPNHPQPTCPKNNHPTPTTPNQVPTNIN